MPSEHRNSRTVTRWLHGAYIDSVACSPDGKTIAADGMGMSISFWDASSGRLRRFELSRVLLADPKLLMLDEPTSGVSPTDKREVIDALALACQGRTVLLIEHDMRVVCELADEVVVLQDKKFLEHGAPADLMQREQRAFREMVEESELDLGRALLQDEQ